MLRPAESISLNMVNSLSGATTTIMQRGSNSKPEAISVGRISRAHFWLVLSTVSASSGMGLSRAERTVVW
tara:strand:+ start:370 stop:579 length:210 start_codon:yes stop_codon:yes gene_type:complete